MLKKFLFLILLVPVLFAVYGLIQRQYDISINSAVTLICIISIYFFNKKFAILSIPVLYLFIVFILLSLFGGRTLNLYAAVPHWDKILHFLSGFILAAAGRDIYTKVNGNAKNILLKHIFILAFGISMAGLWEIIEFFGDNIFNMTSQNNSLQDTMLDIILGSVSSIIYVIFSLVLLKIRDVKKPISLN